MYRRTTCLKQPQHTILLLLLWTMLPQVASLLWRCSPNLPRPNTAWNIYICITFIQHTLFVIMNNDMILHRDKCQNKNQNERELLHTRWRKPWQIELRWKKTKETKVKIIGENHTENQNKKGTNLTSRWTWQHTRPRTDSKIHQFLKDNVVVGRRPT